MDYKDDSDLGRRHPDMEFNMRLFAAAERLSIPGSQSLAKEEFRLAVKHQWDSDCFRRVVAIAYKEIPADGAFRGIIVGIVADHADDLLKKPKFVKLLASSEQLSKDTREAVEKGIGYARRASIAFESVCRCADIWSA
ncbi:hypothetical protein BKA56DRAFT_675666 [Ilyonectria sp. MPI-CAGE-AT-0026]|nr:hypothetical protein BKA56DRAFT_675666 [Ilyonectria sp. MPI-CAGE-AT-0026]